MRKFILLTILWCFSITVFSQTAESKYLIKYLETNTTQPDYGVTFLSDNEFIYKSPNTEKINTNSEKRSESNLFLATVGYEGDIIEKKQIQGLPTNKVTKTGATYSPDLKTVYFSAKKYRKKPRRKDKEQLFKADVDTEGNWINIEKLPFSNNLYSFGKPTLSSNGKELYFNSNMPGTLGGEDIFMVVLDDDGSFGNPINLGNKVNTSGNEVTPYITKDMKLYFSSDNHKDGFGKLDVYSIDLNNPSSELVHLDAPINSINDDFAFIINNSDDRGYFSSDRLQGENNHDIYSFLVEKIKEDGPCLQAITGVVKDNGTKQIIKDAIITLFDEENTEIEQIKTDAEGKYTLNLDCNKTYTLTAEAVNYNTEDHIVNTANYLEAPILEANKFLIKKSDEEIENEKNLISENDGIEEDKIVEKEIDTATSFEDDEATINPVYFGFDKAIITKKAEKELDKLAKILKNNKNIHVELSSYTDSRGSSAYNLKLSERRAQASLQYLVSEGIDRSRIKAKGYGESKMVNKCIDGIECSEAAHEKNRRTEFAFINPQAFTTSFDNNAERKATKITKAKKQAPVKKVVESTSYSESSAQKTSANNIVKELKPNHPEIVAVNKTKTQVENKEKSKIEVPAIKVKLEENHNPNLSELSNNKELERTLLKTELNNQSKKKEETLSNEAKWLNSEIEKSNQEQEESKTEKADKNENIAQSVKEQSDSSIKESVRNIKKKEGLNKPNQLIEPITNTSQNDELNTLVATAKAEEKVEEKFNFERDEKKPNTVNSSTDPNQLLAEVKSKGAYIDPIKLEDDKKENIIKETTPSLNKDAILSTSEVSVKGMQSKRGKYIETDRSKKINALRVIFRIQPNISVEKGYKDAYVVIKSPSGKIVNEKGVFTLENGNDQSYTDLTTIYYNKQSIKAVMFIDKIVHKFTKGMYTVNIFIDGVDVGENVLNLS